MSNTLEELSTETLHSMKAQLQKWMVGLVIVDAVMILAFVLILLNSKAANVIPLIPLLVLPGLIMTPFVLRLTAVRKELARREG